MRKLFSCTDDYCFEGSIRMEPGIHLGKHSGLHAKAKINIDRLWVMRSAMDSADQKMLAEWQQQGIEVEKVDSLEPIIAEHQESEHALG